jgi:glutamate synthase (NADPH/NADH) small chain
MSDYTKPTDESEFEKNFEQIKPLMNSTQAYYESSRCLFCFDAPCVNACPTRIDIPLFIRQISSGNLTGSAKTIYESNYFGYACGKVCPTDVLCEGACVYNLQEVKPIEIGRLQSFATSTAIIESKKLFIPGKPNGKKVAIIGAGPAGISCACELRMRGYEAVIFEAKEKPSGLTVHGVAPYKITNDEVLNEMDYLQKQFPAVVGVPKSLQD